MFDEEAAFREGAEPMLVEAVVTEGTVEALDKGILHRFVGLDVVRARRSSKATTVAPPMEELT